MIDGQAGADVAAGQAATRQAAREHEAAAAALGLRRGLALNAMSHISAAELLLTADAMLAARPGMEAAKCARVEVRHAGQAADVLSGWLVPLALYGPLCARSRGN